MKALLISESQQILDSYADFFTGMGYETLCYRWLLKAMDNLEEIKPDLVFIDASDYPRHWKTLVQHMRGSSLSTPSVFLAAEHLTDEERDKARFLDVYCITSSIEKDDTQQKIRERLHPVSAAGEDKPESLFESVDEPVSIGDSDSIEQPGLADETVFVEEAESAPADELLPVEEPESFSEPIPLEQDVPLDDMTLEEFVSLTDPLPPEETVSADMPVSAGEHLSSDTTPSIAEFVPVEDSVSVEESIPLEKSVSLEAAPVEEPDSVEESIPIEEPVPAEEYHPAEEPVHVGESVAVDEPVKEENIFIEAEPAEKIETEKEGFRERDATFTFIHPSAKTQICGSLLEYNPPLLFFRPDNDSLFRSLRFGQKSDGIIKRGTESINVFVQIQGLDEGVAEVCILQKK